MTKEDKKPAEPKEGKPPTKKEQIIVDAKTEAAREISELSVGQFKEAFGKLYAKIAAEVTGVVDIASLKTPGFLLDIEDPFAAGAARVFAKAKKMDTPRLPIVLPFKDPASRTALDSYIQRAAGGGDTERIKAAAEALAKCK